MQIMKWMGTLIVAAALCAGSALAADPAASAEGSASKDEHAAHAGHAPDAAAPVAGKEEQNGHAGHTDHSGHAGHDMKCCMEMGAKKCMEMGDKKCMEMDGKHCASHKGKKCPHKSHDACHTRKGAAKSDAKKTPAEKKPEGKNDTPDTAKPAAKAAEPALSEAKWLALAQKSNCLACHSIEKKMIGPALKEVAAKYRSDAGAENKLIAKVSRGSSGVWGSVPMPANSPAVKDADIKALVKFVLSLK